MEVLYIQGYDNLYKELQQNDTLKINICNMIKENSSLYAFYDNDKYIVLKIETIDNGDYEEDNLDNLYVLNGNGIEFIDDKDKIERLIETLEKSKDIGLKYISYKDEY
jgi:hypothetical protein